MKKVRIKFAVLNSEYDQEVADEFHGGEESIGNEKFNGYVIEEIKQVQEIVIIDNYTQVHEETDKDGVSIAFSIPDAYSLKLITNLNKTITYSISNKIIQNIRSIEKSKTTYFYFYFKDNIDFVRRGKLFMAKEEIPKELWDSLN